jgi:hypothetical protein
MNKNLECAFIADFFLEEPNSYHLNAILLFVAVYIILWYSFFVAKLHRKIYKIRGVIHNEI